MTGPDPNQPDAPANADWAGLTDTLYAELRVVAESMMRQERGGHTLQPTAVANEACVRLSRRGLPTLPRAEQLALASRVLGQVLIDHARRHGAEKRGGGALRVRLDELEPGAGVANAMADRAAPEFAAVHEALSALRALHPRQAEIVTLRVMGGLTVAQISGLLGVSTRTVESDWAVARAWLRRALDAGGEPGDKA